MENSKIEWTNHTFNPWYGCTKVSAGCANCYAERQSLRKPATLGQWGKGAPRVPASEAKWKEPLKWNEKSRKAQHSCDYTRRVCEANKVSYAEPKPERQRVFCASMADWLDDEVPIEWLTRLLGLIHDTPDLDWLLLSKRPENWRTRLEQTDHETLFVTGDYVAKEWLEGRPPANVWLGTSVEDQEAADKRIPRLLSIPARVRFLSCEPLLGPVNLWSDANYSLPSGGTGSAFDWGKGIQWVIAGGESGPKARPMHADWVRSLRDQCKATGTAFLMKRWGEWLPVDHAATNPDVQEAHDARRADGFKGHTWPDKTVSVRVGKALAGRTLDGLIHDQFPTSA